MARLQLLLFDQLWLQCMVLEGGGEGEPGGEGGHTAR